MSPCHRGHKLYAALSVLSLLCVLNDEAVARSGRAAAEAKKAEAKEAEGEGLLKAGLAALAARDIPTATQKLSDAYMDLQSLECLYALAQLALAEGQTLQAQDLMRRYLADPLLETATGSVEQREAQRIVALPRPPSAWLDIQGSRGTIIKFDGRPIGVLPLAAPMLAPPGEHTIEILAGDRMLREKLRFSAGRVSELRYNLSTRAFIVNVLPGALIKFEAASLQAEEQRRLQQALEEAAQKERYSPLSAATDSKTACEAGYSCALTQAKKLEVEYIVTVRAEKKGPDWTLGLELFDVEVGSSAAATQSACMGCTAEQAASTLGGLLAPLLKKAVDRPRGKVRITSDPSGANLFIDEQLLGVTPYEGPSFVGVHKLILKRKRFEEEKATVEVKEDLTAEARVPLRDSPEPELEPSPACPVCASPPSPPLPPPARTPTWRVATGIVALSAGVLMVGIGAPALALDGRCADEPIMLSAVCTELYQTLPLGGALTGVGGGLVIAGTVLLALPPKSGSQRR